MKVENYQCDVCHKTIKAGEVVFCLEKDFCSQECAVEYIRQNKICTHCGKKIQDNYKLTNIFGGSDVIIKKNDHDIASLFDTVFCSGECLVKYIDHELLKKENE